MLRRHHSSVDVFVAVRASKPHEAQQRSNKAAKPFHLNQIFSAKFNSVQEVLESGSGPGGRWFKSIRPTILFDNLHATSGFSSTAL